MTCQKVINGDENIMYLKDKLNESDIKLLENINIKISNRQYGCSEIYEMAENCVFNDMAIMLIQEMKKEHGIITSRN